MCMTANRTVDMVVDVLGYTEGDESFIPLTPSRLYDSREGYGPVCNVGVRPSGTWVEMVDLVTGCTARRCH